MKLHPATIPYRAFSKLVAVGSILVFAGPNVAGFASGFGIPLTLLLLPLGVLAVAAIVAYEVAYYRRFNITLADDTLQVYSGVFARQEREIPYRRIQNVDVTSNVVQRLLDIAQVKVETAGGGETEATLRFVSRAQATELQERLRTLKRRATTPDDAADAPAPEVEVLFELDDRGLVILSLLSMDARVLGGLVAVATIAGPIGASILEGFAGVALLALLAVGVLGMGALLWAAGALSTFVQYYGFRLTRVDDDLRYERGLLQKYDGTIPLEKIQAFAVEEHVLMRRFGFAALAVQTAGYAPGQGPARGSEAAIPLATREQVLELANHIDSDVPFAADMRAAFDRPPARARRRYTVRYALVALVLVGIGLIVSMVVRPWPWYVLLVGVLPAPFAARATCRNRGWTLDDEFVLTENGFWKRTTHAVPYDRVQTIIDRRTVFQRRWGLATVYADTASTAGIAGQDPAAVDVPREAVDEFRGALADRVFEAVRRPVRGRI